MRYLYATYPLDCPGIPEREGYLDAIREVTGDDLSAFFARYIGGTEELPYAETFAVAGLRLAWDWKKADSGATRPTLGLRSKSEGGSLKVTGVVRDGPAYAAGISADDELVALNGYRVADEGTLRERLNDCKDDDRVVLTLFRREELQTVEVTLAAAPHDMLSIEQAEHPNEVQRAIYASWLATK